MLRVEGLGVRIRTGRRALRALDDVGFSLRRAETLGLVGESGCGKTLTALALMRLAHLKKKPLQGVKPNSYVTDITWNVQDWGWA